MTVYTPQRPASRLRKQRRNAGLSGWIAGLFSRSTRPPAPVGYRPPGNGREPVRPGRWRRLFWRLFLLGVVLGSVIMAGWLGSRALFQSNIFVLSDIRIRGAHMATSRQILDLAGLQQGGSLLRFDAKAAEARIKTHPWVDEVEIQTHWPSAVEILVVEHQPFALVNVEAGEERRLLYMDHAGRLFADAAHGQDLDYPVITGVRDGEDVKNGSFAPASLAASAYKLLQLAAQGNAILPVQAISEVHADPGRGLILYLVDRPFPIYFGADNLRTKYFRLVKVLEQLYAKKQIDAVNDIRMDYLDDKVLVTGTKIDG